MTERAKMGENGHETLLEKVVADGDDETSSLFRAARAVLEYSSFEATARIIFDEARRMTDARSGYVALLSLDGSENAVLFLEAGGLPCNVDPSLPMPIRGLRAEAYRTCSVVYDNHFMEGPWAELMPAGHVDLHNVLFAPLVIDGKTQGIMGLANKPTAFTEGDAKIAAAFGEFAAVALRNSRMLDQLRNTVEKLEVTLDEVKTLRGILPICSSCKKIRDEAGSWFHIEEYVSNHSYANFTHGLCEECIEKLYGKDYL